MGWVPGMDPETGWEMDMGEDSGRGMSLEVEMRRVEAGTRH